MQTGFAPFDGSQSAGTTSPEAGLGRVRPFTTPAGGPCISWLATFTSSAAAPHLLVSSISVLWESLSYTVEAVRKKFGVASRCSEIGCLQAKLARLQPLPSGGRERACASSTLRTAPARAHGFAARSHASMLSGHAGRGSPKSLHKCSEVLGAPRRAEQRIGTPRARSATPNRGEDRHTEKRPTSADTASDRSPARLRRYQTRR